MRNKARTDEKYYAGNKAVEKSGKNPNPLFSPPMLPLKRMLTVYIANNPDTTMTKTSLISK